MANPSLIRSYFCRKAPAIVWLKKKSPYRFFRYTVGEVEVPKVKKTIFQIVPLSEAIKKLDQEAALKSRGDPAGTEELPEVRTGRPHRSVNSGKKPGSAQVQLTRAESEINYG